MTGAAAAFYDARCFDGRALFRGDFRRIPRALRSIGGNVVFGAGAVAVSGLLIVTVTLAAGWMVGSSHSSDRYNRGPMGPGALVLAANTPNLADASTVAFADKWARATASMQVSAVPLLPQDTQIAKLAPVEIPAVTAVNATSLPQKRPVETAHIVP
ncbi:MAG TPA: hypothetical protein VGF02_14395, partial [Pseudolabrys sp.]